MKILHICRVPVRLTATGFKSLHVNCFEINQLTSKYQIDFLDKTWILETEKVNITIEFCIFELAKVPNFTLNKQC